MSNEDMAKFIGDGKIQVMPHFKTLRDEIAIEVLKYLLTVPQDAIPMHNRNQATVCRATYEWADAMLKARESSSTE